MFNLEYPYITHKNYNKWIDEENISEINTRFYSKIEGNLSFRLARIKITPTGIELPSSGMHDRHVRPLSIIEEIIDTAKSGNNGIFDLWGSESIYEILAAPTTTFITSTSGSTQSWSVPADWNNSNNYVDCIGGGGHTDGSPGIGAGGGGGAWARKSNLTLSGSATYKMPTPSIGSSMDVWFNGATLAAASVGASGASGISAGLASSSVGDSKYSGGNGAGYVSPSIGGAGGGAAGPNGNGAAASSSIGGGADNGSGGSGGSGYGIAGGNGTEYDASHGSGGGGGSNANGGNYGGGAGCQDFGGGVNRTGAQGLIVVVYTPLVRSSMLMVF